MPIDPADVEICLAPDEAAEPAEPTDADQAAAEAAGGAGATPLPMSAPIVQTSLFSFPTFRSLVKGLADERHHTVYTRGRNPTVQALDRKLAALERGDAAATFASGMAAVSAVLLGLLEAGDRILFVNQVYGPTLELARHLRRFGISHDIVLDLGPDAVEAAIRRETRLLWIESPGTMLFRLADVAAIAQRAASHGVITVLDNSWATPLFQKPLEAGIDVVVHSASKYLGGHSDLLAGAVVTSEECMERIFDRAYMLNGGILSPFDAWLLLRGLRTLPARMRQHEADALAVADFLRGHSAIRRVHHPIRSESPSPAEAGLTGTSGLFSVELVRGDFAGVEALIDGLRRFRIGVSWGGVESLVISPERGDNGAALEAARIPRGLVRLSIGLEGADALIRDLDAALAASA